MGMPANFTGQPNAQNMAAGESLAALVAAGVWRRSKAQVFSRKV